MRKGIAENDIYNMLMLSINGVVSSNDASKHAVAVDLVNKYIDILQEHQRKIIRSTVKQLIQTRQPLNCTDTIKKKWERLILETEGFGDLYTEYLSKEDNSITTH